MPDIGLKLSPYDPNKPSYEEDLKAFWDWIRANWGSRGVIAIRAWMATNPAGGKPYTRTEATPWYRFWASLGKPQGRQRFVDPANPKRFIESERDFLARLSRGDLRAGPAPQPVAPTETAITHTLEDIRAMLDEDVEAGVYTPEQAEAIFLQHYEMVTSPGFTDFTSLPLWDESRNWLRRKVENYQTLMQEMQNEVTRRQLEEVEWLTLKEDERQAVERYRQALGSATVQQVSGQWARERGLDTGEGRIGGRRWRETVAAQLESIPEYRPETYLERLTQNVPPNVASFIQRQFPAVVDEFERRFPGARAAWWQEIALAEAGGGGGEGTIRQQIAQLEGLLTSGNFQRYAEAIASQSGQPSITAEDVARSVGENILELKEALTTAERMAAPRMAGGSLREAIRAKYGEEPLGRFISEYPWYRKFMAQTRERRGFRPAQFIPPAQWG